MARQSSIRVACLILFLLAVCTAGVAQTRVYVADTAGNTVSIVDAEAGRVTATVPVSPGPAGLALWTDVNSTKKHRLYVSSAGKNVLDVLDVTTAKLVSSVPVGQKPGCLALSPDGRRVFVCLAGRAAVDVVDTSNLQRVGTIEMSGWGGSPRGLFVTPDHTRIFAAGDRKLAVINVRSHKVEFAIDVDGAVEGVAFDADKHLVIRRVFLQVAGSRGVEVLDYESRKVTGRIALPAAVTGLAVSADGATLWVSTAAADSVSAFALADLKKTATIATDRGPGAIVCAADPKNCYVANAGGSVSVIDPGAMKETRRIPVGKNAGSIVVGE